jgi:hypothetical protein
LEGREVEDRVPLISICRGFLGASEGACTSRVETTNKVEEIKANLLGNGG